MIIVLYVEIQQPDVSQSQEHVLVTCARVQSRSVGHQGLNPRIFVASMSLTTSLQGTKAESDEKVAGVLYHARCLTPSYTMHARGP